MRTPLLLVLTSLLAACGGPEENAITVPTSTKMLSSVQRAKTAQPSTLPYLRHDYVMTATAAGIAVRLKSDSADAGVVVPFNTVVRFSDASFLPYAETGAMGQAYRLYRAAFNRTPDVPGLLYWMGVMNSGTSVESVAGGFVSSAEFKQVYGASTSDPQIVTRLYRNVLGREPEAAGLDFWKSALAKGVPLAQILESFSESDENKAGVRTAVQDGVAFREDNVAYSGAPAPAAAGSTVFSALPPASTPVEGSIPDWLIFKSSSPVTGVTTTLLTASSLKGDFVISCSGGKFSYYIKTSQVTANGNVMIRIGNNPVASEAWSESSSNNYRVLFPKTVDVSLLQNLYKNWDFVMSYNAYGYGTQNISAGSAGFSSAIDKTRADCGWSTEMFPPQNGWGLSLPKTPPNHAKEATNVSGNDASKSTRMIAWRAINASGKQQLLVRLGDAANSNNMYLLSDRRLYVTQDGKTVSAVSGYDFQTSASNPVILAVNGAFDASRPLRLTMMAFHFNTIDALTPIAVVDLD